ncbi:MAG: hypothetical protein ABI318_22150 [Chthoniobacteraceae bacterium]
MSTLAEIEEAVDSLPQAEQVALLRHIESKLPRAMPACGEILMRNAGADALALAPGHTKAVTAPASEPDFLSRAKAIWGEAPAGKPLSALVSEARG